MREMAIYLVARALICIHNWFACIFTHTYMHKRSYWRSYWPLCCKEAKRECVLMCRQHNGTTQRWAVPTTKRASQKPEKCEQRRRRSGQLASVNSFGCTQEEWRAANKEVRKSTFIFHAANAFVVVVVVSHYQQLLLQYLKLSVIQYMPQQRCSVMRLGTPLLLYNVVGCYCCSLMWQQTRNMMTVSKHITVRLNAFFAVGQHAHSVAKFVRQRVGEIRCHTLRHASSWLPWSKATSGWGKCN